MTKHARIPALVAVVGALGLGLAVLAATGQFRSNDLGKLTCAQLERRIGSGNADAAVWLAYGDVLYGGREFGKSAEVYQRALELAAVNGDGGGGVGFDADKARFEQALALAQCGRPDEFFTYFNALASMYPKVAVDLLDRPELGAVHKDARWEFAASAARAQAVD